MLNRHFFIVKLNDASQLELPNNITVNHELHLDLPLLVVVRHCGEIQRAAPNKLTRSHGSGPIFSRAAGPESGSGSSGPAGRAVEIRGRPRKKNEIWPLFGFNLATLYYMSGQLCGSSLPNLDDGGVAYTLRHHLSGSIGVPGDREGDGRGPVSISIFVDQSNKCSRYSKILNGRTAGKSFQRTARFQANKTT